MNSYSKNLSFNQKKYLLKYKFCGKNKKELKYFDIMRIYNSRENVSKWEVNVSTVISCIFTKIIAFKTVALKGIKAGN